MVYIEQPDGSGHQFTLTDRRQATDPRDPNTIGNNQDRAKIAPVRGLPQVRLSAGRRAVERISEAAGPGSNIFVVSDHGMAPFHTAVNMANILRNAGVDTSQLAIRTSGPAVNIYVNLQGRESGGTVDPATYSNLVTQIATPLKNATDPNDRVQLLAQRTGGSSPPSRSGRTNCAEGLGLCTSRKIGQDFGDVFAHARRGLQFRRHPEPRSWRVRAIRPSTRPHGVLGAEFLRRARPRFRAASR